MPKTEAQYRHGNARLERRVVAAAKKWQAQYPSPSRTDDPQLHALWAAVDALLAHQEARAPATCKANEGTAYAPDGSLRIVTVPGR